MIIFGPRSKVAFLMCIRWASSHLRPLCQWLTAGWDVRGLLFTLMMTHCGIVPLILSPALWIKNTLWLTLRTLWPFESWQGRKRHVCHAEKPPCLCYWGPSCRKTLSSCFQHLTLYNDYYGRLPCTASIYPLSCAACLISAAFDQHPRLFKSTDSPNADWVSYSYVPKWTFSAYHTHNVTWQRRVRISLNQP